MPRAPKKQPEVKEPQKQTRQVAYWISEISAAKKREKTFRKDGDRILEIYEGKKSATTPFNILFSNTETMLPALYSAIPRPVVDRRFKDEDPVGKNAAEAGKRMLEFLIDTNVEGYETFDEAMRAATLDALLPGRGVTCEKYDAEVDNLPTESVDDAVPAAEDVENKQEDAQEGEEESAYKKWELVCSDSRSWNRVYFGYAKKWSKVPWVAFEEDIDKVEATRLFGAAIAGQLSYSETDDDEDKKADRDEADEGERKTARIYQVWDKSGGRKIRYIADQYKDDYLKVEDDPLQLTGFYNIPRPLTFLEKSNDLLPVAMYILYEYQAKELNKIQVRINRIVDAIKARGIYDSELGDDIADLMKADDNALVPADKSSSLAAEKGLQNAIWFMPLDQLVATLQQLYQARESCKQVIYEITGIADIMRGSSNASETLGAQEIKQSWGTLRLKRLQKEVQRYARDLLRIKLEIAATKFSEETWARMTGLPFLTEAKFAELQAVSRALQQQIATAPPPMAPADPSQPPAPPPPDPTQQQLAQVQQQLQTPQWSQILDVLRDDMQRAYRIDIETNSTVDPDATEDQKNIADLMTAFGQAMNSLGPLVAQGVLPFDMAKSMLLIIIRRYRFGSELEDYINQMQPPKPPPDANAGDAQKLAAEMDARKHEAQINASTEAAKLQDGKERKQAEMQAEAAKLQMEDATKRFLAGEETKREQMRLEAERREKQADRQAQRVLEEMKLNKQAETELNKASLAAAVAIETTTITATKSAETATAANEAAGAQTASTAQVMDKILARQDKLLATLAAPKTVERDPKTGKALRLVTEMAGG